MRHIKKTNWAATVVDALDARCIIDPLTGRRYPIPAGGAGDGDGGGDGGGEGGSGPGGDGGEGGGGEGDLGDAGKRAIQAERDRAKERDQAAKAAERERDQARRELEELKAKGKTDSEKEAEKAATAAAAEATKAERARSDRRIVAAELKAAATGKLADPSDALVFVDREKFTVDDDGEVDAKAIGAAIDDLIKAKPHLAKPAGESGDYDQGARGGPAEADVKPGLPRLRRAFADTSKK